MKPSSLHGLILLALIANTLSLSWTSWRSLITRIDDKEDDSIEEIEKMLNIEYEPSDYFEEMITQFSPSLPFFSKFMKRNMRSTCEERRSFSGPDFLQFMPQTMAVLRNTGEEISFTNDCFKTNIIKLQSKESGKVVLSMTSSDPTAYFCKDSYLMAISSRFKVKLVFRKGEHQMAFDKLTDDEMVEIAVNGIRVFSFCENIVESLKSIYKTYRLFTDEHSDPEKRKKYPYYLKKTSEELEVEHMKLLNKFSDIPIEPRGPMGNIPLPVEDSIQSGDFLGLTEIRSFGSVFLMYFTGGAISHAAIALRLDGKLYVAEMKGSGLIIAPWKEFVESQIQTHHSIVHCPLKKEYRDKFNTQKAYEYFFTLGKKYGIYAAGTPWFDVPNKATAIYLPEENIMLFLSLMDKYKKNSAYSMFGAALNMRLGAFNLSISEIAVQAAKRNMTFEELLAVPENDDWRYETGENVVCSSFVMQMYRVGGLFDDIVFNAKEFQPKDIYLLDIFDKEFDRPQMCREVDPDLPYCQILGRYRIWLKGYSSVPPHDHMFDHCPSVPPYYNITDMC